MVLNPDGDKTGFSRWQAIKLMHLVFNYFHKIRTFALLNDSLYRKESVYFLVEISATLLSMLFSMYFCCCIAVCSFDRHFEVILIEYVCVCVCLCVCVFPSIHGEGFICLEQLEYQGTDQRCCVEDASFLHQVPSLPL